MKKEPKMVIAIRKDLNMRKGKMAAQASHAALMFLVSNNDADRADELHVKLSKEEAEWLFNAMPKIVVGVQSEDELRDLVVSAKLKNIAVHTVTDAGRTEFHGEPMITCAAFGPDDPDAINEITGHLTLL